MERLRKGPNMVKTNISLDPTRTGREAESLEGSLHRLIVGQDEAIQQIVNIYQMHLTGMSAPGRPIGNFLFLGPTGSGKTRIVEATAECLLKNPRAVIKIDCAEFQHSHEIAKLIGSPPGYLGHRETHPLLSQEVLNQYHTDQMKLSFVLFDEIEKASDALWNLLLGILDKATLTLGDNRKVDFSRAMIFMTSNLGATEMSSLMNPKLGFCAPEQARRTAAGEIDEKLNAKLKNSSVEAARRKFTPEFINRLDKIVTFRPLGCEELRSILDIELNMVQQRIFNTTPETRVRLQDHRSGQGFSARRRHRSEVRRPASEARHRTPAGAAHVQPDRHRPGARRRLGESGFRQRKPELTFAREAEGLPVTPWPIWWITPMSVPSFAMAAGAAYRAGSCGTAQNRLEKAREARSQAISGQLALPLFFFLMPRTRRGRA